MKAFAKTITILTMIIILSATAYAETKTVSLEGISTYGRVSMHEGENFIGWEKAMEFIIGMDGELFPGYCADLYAPIDVGWSFEAELNNAPIEEAWCQIAHILRNNQATDDFSGSAIQLAIWKLVHPDKDLNVGQLDIEEAANQMLLDSADSCPLACTGDFDLELDAEEEDGLVNVTAILTQQGEVIAGENVNFSLSAGTIISPENGMATTDADGQILLTLELDESSEQVEVSAEVNGQWITLIEPVDETQDLVTVALDAECSESTSAILELDSDDDESEIGKPRGPWFYKRQLKCATKKVKKNKCGNHGHHGHHGCGNNGHHYGWGHHNNGCGNHGNHCGNNNGCGNHGNHYGNNNGCGNHGNHCSNNNGCGNNGNHYGNNNGCGNHGNHCGNNNGCGNNNVRQCKIDKDTFEGWLDIEIFGQEITSLKQLKKALKGKKGKCNKAKNKAARAKRHCLATLLNVEYGQLEWDSMVDTDGDREGDTNLSEAFSYAEEAFYNGDYRAARKMCRMINRTRAED